MRKFFVAAVLGAWLGFLTLLPRGSSYIWLAFGERQYRSWQVFLDQPTWVPWMARALALLLVLLYALWAAEQGYLAPKPRHQKLGMIWWVSVSLLSAANLVFAPEKVLSLVGWLLAGLFLILSWLPRLGKRPADWAWRVLACEMALVGLFSAWLGLVLQLWPQVLRDHVAELPLLVPAALAWGAVVGMSAVLPIVWLGPAPGQALRAAPLLALGMLLGWWLGPSSSSLPGGLGGSEPSFFTVHLCGPGRPVETVPSMPVDLLGSEVPRLEAWW